MRSSIVVLSVSLLATPYAIAQSYPTKPIRLIIPFASGAAGDTVARLIAPQLTAAAGVAEVAPVGGMPQEYQVDVRPEDLRAYGLDAPALTVKLTFSGREPMTLVVGKTAPEKDGSYDLAYVHWRCPAL